MRNTVLPSGCRRLPQAKRRANHLYSIDKLVMVYPTTDTQRGVTCTDGVLCGVATALVGASLLAAACTESKTDSSTEASTASANGASATTTAPTGSNEWALTYTGGTEGPADDPRRSSSAT